MDFMKYLLGGEGGLGARVDQAMPIKPDGSLPARPIDRIMEGNPKPNHNNMGFPAGVDVPLHVVMQNKGIPYLSWPQEAKDELSPALRKAYEDDLAKRESDLYAMPMRPVDKIMSADKPDMSGLLTASANSAPSQPNPYMQALLAGADNARNRMASAQMNPAPRSMTKPEDAFNNKFRELRMKVASGQLTEAQARQVFQREFMDRQPNTTRGNPFG